jgi:tetratricopeptide (TPR) repeat protein
MTAPRLLWNNSPMKLVAVLVCVAGTVAVAEAGQNSRSSKAAAPPAAAVSSYKADAYNQYLQGRRLERDDDVDGAIAAYKRSFALDPMAADVEAELAGLYLRQNRVADSVTAAEQALKIDPKNVEGHRVLGTLYAAVSDTETRAANGRSAGAANESAAKAIGHFEEALADVDGEAEPTMRATLARMYVRTGSFDKAIPILRDLVSRERGWQEGVTLLAEAYAGAGKNAEAIAWLEEEAPDNPRLYATLGDFYERARRWNDSANAFGIAVQRQPRNADLKIRYGSALLNAGGRENAVKARDTLSEAASGRSNDQRVLYLLSQAQRRAGDASAAEATARRVITLNRTSPWGYYALAEALQERQQYQAIVDTIGPVLNDFRSRTTDGAGLALLLPHVGFAYEQLGQYDSAIASFNEAHRLDPSDGLITS